MTTRRTNPAGQTAGRSLNTAASISGEKGRSAEGQRNHCTCKYTSSAAESAAQLSVL